ncbi:helicase-exonuclease AddAB subunit AddA [Paenibacillus sp. HB172176]|uniref:helicase-exonuclease AddAB subunit AddA n=1 Tax=Paenibacillus sp. HB172176 TaxID=2493690 RepID=UPI00198233B1|nr:helicase-exonuclease AddAB subunit AddA [Paenibacillus sp. HB172176]
MSQPMGNRTPKPAGSTWTDEQWQAIVTSGSNVLVAAAAGSGKTAVLVERIIRKIASNTDVDRLLVATFTKAAAAEMKDRIRIALEKELDRDPGSEHLRKQLALMGRASITTLHSFCMDVIRRYYSLIGLDPGFRIANETESELLRLDVLDELFEHRYSDEAPDKGAFLMLADRFGGEKGDEPLYRLVQQLYEFSRSHPWPEHWLMETAGSYNLGSEEELEQSNWAEVLRKDLVLSLSGAQSLIEQGLELTRLPGGPAPYADNFEADEAVILELQRTIRASSWRSWPQHFRAAAFGRLKSARGDEYDKELQEQAKSLRDAAKKIIGDLTEELFGRSALQFLEELQELAPLMAALSQLVIDFGERYEAAKRSKGLLDFGDLEHYCLRILRSEQSEPGKLVPSSAAVEYQRQFDEILLDEYQDTNMVQEAIISLIARGTADDEAWASGNRFMVGDVKQSIYRFRLAEPNLFLSKYRAYPSYSDDLSDESRAAQEERIEAARSPEFASYPPGIRIDLARNFRSRQEVVDGVNSVFRAIMRANVAEMDYDPKAELVAGAAYPEPKKRGDCKVQFALLDRGGDTGLDHEEARDADAADHQEVEAGSSAYGEMENASELQTVQLEARYIANQLQAMMDADEEVFDPRRKSWRKLEWRDVVILLRATQAWTPVIIDELQQRQIPAYAELSSGYFEAVEVETMLSLLRVVDNPYQDIPLASVLRSPLFAMKEEELARIRILSPKASYYDAVLHAAGDESLDKPAGVKLALFLESLERWRIESRQGSLVDLIWRIYTETGYYDFVGGLPGGLQRQANLRALHDRARQYEATSFRGLFRFLRFIERMRDSGGDLGTARALGEQEDVVRIMSIHKSKGLEFPVVFVAGLGKMFNQQDLRKAFLMHKELGFGPRYIDPDLRISYPAFSYLAIRKALRMELLAEEMRILYVALTRPKEKLFLVGTVSDAEKKLQNWRASRNQAGQITDYRIATARSFLDWLGPICSAAFENEATIDGAAWIARILPESLFGVEAAAALHGENEAETEIREAKWLAIRSLAELDDVERDHELRERLEWEYPYQEAAGIAAKTSVTEMKRLQQEAATDAYPLFEQSNSREDYGAAGALSLTRPSFMARKTLTAAEKGSVNHLFMQHMPLHEPISQQKLQEVLSGLILKKLITEKQAEAVHLASVEAFMGSELGKRLQKARWVERELPFNSMLPAGRVYAAADIRLENEPILIQGVIDCLFEDERGVILVDYKTDRIADGSWEQAAERHRFQLELYSEAIEGVIGRRVAERHVFFFDGAVSVQL